MWDQGTLDMGAELWFAAAVAGPQVLGAGLYRAARGADRAGRREFLPIPLAAGAIALLQGCLGVPGAMLAAPLAVLASGALVAAGGEGGVGRGPLLIGGGLLIWCALLVSPVAALGLGAEFGPLLALLTAGLAVAAHGGRLARVYADPACEPPLPWFLWSASHGGWALMAMFAGLPWPLLAFPLVAQAMSLGIGIFALEGGAERREREGAAR